MTRNKPSAEELAEARFRKASASGPNGNECVEVAQVREWACVRDSKVSQGPTVVVPAAAFSAAVEALASNAL
ncbi:DUF397 domain-containing protein [Streptomyces sp. NPDC059534]|uniref:DUF397 domain-containing protein n=1 Tax=Streptomyces sp. NPDC059534 TaxID=3346859 RepID=UPI0036A4D063